MVNRHNEQRFPSPGTIVAFPWGLGEMRGRVVEVYGPPGRPQVLIELTPGLSGDIVDEPTTVSFPLDAVTVSTSVA